MKTCNICKAQKAKEEYYKHPKTADGFAGKCKSCTKEFSINSYQRRMQNPEFALAERIRSREKSKRRIRVAPPEEKRREWQQGYVERYPEKYAARTMATTLPHAKGFHNHHWSYQEQHFKDVIPLSAQEHKFLHRYLVYDAERKQYRRCTDGILLDTREAHEAFIQEIKVQAPY